MTWEQALEIVIARTKHERYRDLCADDWPDHEAYRAEMIRMVSEPPSFPPMRTQAGKALVAAIRSAHAFLVSEPVRVLVKEQERRWSICLACEYLDGGRCRICGCHMRAKTHLALERCPLDPPKW